MLSSIAVANVGQEDATKGPHDKTAAEDDKRVDDPRDFV
jgi:hypothetical protein